MLRTVSLNRLLAGRADGPGHVRRSQAGAWERRVLEESLVEGFFYILDDLVQVDIFSLRERVVGRDLTIFGYQDGDFGLGVQAVIFWSVLELVRYDERY